MSELLYARLKENLEALKMRNTLDILDNYLERAMKDELNIVDVLDHIFAEEARSRRHRAYEKQIQMSGFPMKKNLEDFDFSFQPFMDKRQINELATMRFVENAENVVFSAPPGVGKTHLTNALGMLAAKNRYFTQCLLNNPSSRHDGLQIALLRTVVLLILPQHGRQFSGRDTHPFLLIRYARSSLDFALPNLTVSPFTNTTRSI